MRIRRLVARGYRNLADLDCEVPYPGLVLLGANAQGKTNLLEAIYYPVLFRSFRGAADGQVMGAPPGFSVEVHIGGEGSLRLTFATEAFLGDQTVGTGPCSDVHRADPSLRSG